MNRISFRGSSELIRDFSDRFLDHGPGIFEPLDETEELYGDAIMALAESSGADVGSIQRVLDFLVARDVAGEEIGGMLEGDDPWILTLARDVDTLAKYISDGTIMDVRILEG